MVLSKLKHFSRKAMAIFRPGVSENEGVNRRDQQETYDNGHEEERHELAALGQEYEKLETIQHQTTFAKACQMFSSRSLIIRRDFNNERVPQTGCMDRSTNHQPYVRAVAFRPVTSQDRGVSRGRGNVTFTFRCLNGSQGIWNEEDQCGEDVSHKATSRLRHYVHRSSDIADSTLPTQILFTRREYPGLEEYDPRIAVRGPWKVCLDPTSGKYEHYVKRPLMTNNNAPLAQVEFIFDSSVLDPKTHQDNEHLLEGISVCYCEWADTFRDTSASHMGDEVTIGVLRLVLAATTYRWPGGIHLNTAKANNAPSSSFPFSSSSRIIDVDSIMRQYERYHSWMVRDIQVNADAGQVPNPLPEQTVNGQHWLQTLRSASLPELRYLLHRHPYLINDICAYLQSLSSEIESPDGYQLLRRGVHCLVTLLSRNCLEVTFRCQQGSVSGQTIPGDFDELYGLMLMCLPDRRAQKIFRSIIRDRLAKALDSH